MQVNAQILNEKSNTQNEDNQTMQIILDSVKKYNLSLYFEDIQQWDDPDKILKLIDYEIKSAISYLTIDKLIDTKKRINYQSIDLDGAYKLDLKNKNLLLDFKYKDSDTQTIKFNIWKSKRQEVMENITKKINDKHNFYNFVEENWTSPSKVIEFGQKYLLEIKKIIGQEIEVKDEKIKLNLYRWRFKSWDINKSQHIIFQYHYLLKDQFISLKVPLRNKLKPSQIIEKILSLISKDILNVKINQKVDWEKIEQYKETFNNYINKIMSAVKIIAKTLKIDLFNWTFKVAKISPIGPFENEVVVSYKFGNSNKLLPIKFSFEHTVDKNLELELEKALNNIFKDYYISSDQVSKFSEQFFRKLVNFNSNKIIVNNVNIPFNSVNLTIEKTEVENQKLVVFCRHPNLSKSFKVSINIIN